MFWLVLVPVSSTQLANVKGRPCWVENMGSSFVTITEARREPGASVELTLKDSVVDMGAQWVIGVLGAQDQDVIVCIVQTLTIAGYRPRACLFRLIVTVRFVFVFCMLLARATEARGVMVGRLSSVGRRCHSWSKGICEASAVQLRATTR